jgi:hypothetical protein
MKRVEVLALEAVQPGMKVAVAVLDGGGRVLVPAGAEVSSSMLASLARREVAAIAVELEVEEDPALREAQRIAHAARLDELFRKAGDAPETRTLYEAVLAHRLENPK